MRRLIRHEVAAIACLLGGSWMAMGADGDITGASVPSHGYAVNLYVSGFGTNIFVDTALGTNGNPTPSSKLRLLVESPGYDEVGASITRRREVWGTIALRTPGVTNVAALPAGAGSVIAIAVSDPVWTNDTVVSLEAGAGLLAFSGTNSASATLTTITNTSELPYPQVIAQHSEPAHRIMVDGVTRIIGFGHWADGGSPLAAVWTITTGLTSSHSVTTIVSRMTIIRDRQRGLPFAEFATTTDMSGFTDNELVKIDKVAFPQVGNASAVFDTRLGAYTWPDHRLCTITNRWDPDDDWCRLAAVWSAAGTDATGTIFDRTVTDPTAVANHFLTAAGAANALQATNNIVNGRQNTDGCTIFARAGVTNWMGQTHTVGATPQTTYLIVTNYPGEQATLTTRLTSNDSGNFIKFDGLGFNWSSTQVPINNLLSVWLRNCDIVSASLDWIQGTAAYQIWYDDCRIGPDSQGLKANVGSSLGSVHVRNCDLEYLNTQSIPQFFAGNIRRGTNGGTTITIDGDRAGMTGVSPDGAIFFNNLMEGQASGSEYVVLCKYTNFTMGVAMVQCVWVKSSNPSLGPLSSIASGVTNSADNGILWYCDFIGARQADRLTSNGYTNGYGTRRNWSIQGNVMNTAVGWKLDLTAPVDADKFSLPSFGTFIQNEWYGEATTDEVAGNSFPPDFAGLFSYHPPIGLTFTNLVDAYGLRTYPVLGGDGLGEYRLKVESPGHSQQQTGYRFPRWSLPYDLFGHPRSMYDPPGAVVVGRQRKGG